MTLASGECCGHPFFILPSSVDAQKSSHVLVCIERSMISRSSTLILLLYSALVGSCLEWWIQLWDHQHQNDMNLLKQFQRRDMKMIRELDHLSYEDRLAGLELFSLEKRKLEGHLTIVFQYLKEAYKKAEQGHFIRAYSYRTRRNGFKLKEGRLRLINSNELFMVRVMRH
ncbi:hypothetical protein WISP_119431 [Willisornis vidua]|uniref:Uncharacterized protein n=1 Tax=Willisornis vidua TaxID=1566151 RepID=A0ABQ9CSS1_9PASS|nr:hypothetical protein WISP_119431 [Willisornis vidua]